MDEHKLLAILSREVNDSVGGEGSELVSDQAQAMEYYLGKPFGNEVEGRSQVVLTDVADTVEWIMPSLIRIFTSGRDTVAFEPSGQEDTEQADQATDYINHIFLKDNPGFMIYYNWFKDALLQKVGVVKYYYEEEDEEEKETYYALTDEQLRALIDDGWEPIEYEAEYDNNHDVTVRRTNKKGQVKIETVPNEEFLISKRARNIPDSPFVAHKVKRTLSTLRESGYEESKIQRLITYGQSAGLWTSELQTARSKYTEEEPTSESEDESMREIDVYECYVRIDYDGDGRAELRKVTYSGNVILDNEEWEGCSPFALLCPIPIPHKVIGLSIADLLMDLQLIRSTILRQILDNMYNINNGRYVVLENAVNLDDLLRSRPGGVVREKIPNAVRRLDTPSFHQGAFSLLEYFEGVKENRSGVTRYNQGMHANTLNKTATGINRIMSAAYQRIEMIARIFAETGIKDLFRGILHLVCKYQQRERIVKLRNEWTPMDPREWDHRMNLTINVGLGTGSQEQSMQSHMMFLQIQRELAERLGLGVMVDLPQIYNTLKEISKDAGFTSVEPYFIDPADLDPQALERVKQGKPNPEEVKAQAEMQKAQFEQEKMRMQGTLDAQRAQAEQQKIAMEAELETQKAQLEREKMVHEAQMAEKEFDLKSLELRIKEQEARAREKQGSD